MVDWSKITGDLAGRIKEIINSEGGDPDEAVLNKPKEYDQLQALLSGMDKKDPQKGFVEGMLKDYEEAYIIRSETREIVLDIVKHVEEAHEARKNGEKVGSLGDMACFSFYPTKNMTTSEGGIITTDDEELADNARIFRAHGASIRYHHDDIGYNFRMTDISAAIGLAQLENMIETVWSKGYRFITK